MTHAEYLYDKLDAHYRDLSLAHQALSDCYAPNRRGQVEHIESARLAERSADYYHRHALGMASGLIDSAQEPTA